MGPIMLDISGFELSAEEREMLEHPLVGGIILFSRNYHDQEQLSHLVASLRTAARNDVLIAVDHEGGRVQRFRDGFSAIPAMGKLCKTDTVSEQARSTAESFGWLMAAELLAFDIDISFAPVLDLHGVSDVIGDRSFHPKPQPLIELASRFIAGMHDAGMKATGKHFPGHGNVKEDSHIAMPVDERSRQTIFDLDMSIFRALIEKRLLDGVMPAHVIYPKVDSLPAGFSEVWVKQILRQQLGFDGVVFTDDLSMQGAAHIGSFVDRAITALHAGCDMALVCNQPKAAAQVLDGLDNSVQAPRVKQLRKSTQLDWSALKKTKKYQQATRELEHFYES